MRNLNGKTAVVSGGGCGIGRELCLRLAGRGAVVAVADIDPDRAKTVAEEITGLGGSAEGFAADVSREPDVRRLREEVTKRFGPVDVVVNNAGIVHPPIPSAEFVLEDFRRVLDINLYGTVHGSLVFLLRRPEANLVNIGSYAGLVGVTSMSAYSTSKFGVRGFTEALRMELHGTPVSVTLVLPGATKTSIMRNSPLVDTDRRDELQQAFERGPGGSAGAVAERTLQAILRNKSRVLVGTDTRGLDLITRALPGRYTSLLAKPMKTTIARNFG